MFSNETKIGSYYIRCKYYTDTSKCLELLRNTIIIANVETLMATSIYTREGGIYIDIVSNKHGYFTRNEILKIKNNIVSITKEIELDRCTFEELDTDRYTFKGNPHPHDYTNNTKDPYVAMEEGNTFRKIYEYILSFFK